MIALTDRFGQAVAALRDNRLRTALSVLGIAIGIAAVMIVSTISRGGNHLVFSELQTFGLNSAWIYRDWDNDSPLERRREGSGIDSRDIAALQAARGELGIRHLSPIVQDYGEPSARRGGRFANVQLIGASVAYPDIVNDTLLGGRRLMHHDVAQRLPAALVVAEIVEVLGRHGDPVFGAAFLVLPLRLADGAEGPDDIARLGVLAHPLGDVLVEDRDLVPVGLRLKVAPVVLASVFGGDADPEGVADFLVLPDPADDLELCEGSHGVSPRFECFDEERARRGAMRSSENAEGPHQYRPA